MKPAFENSIFIAATTENVWCYLTEPERMARWMGEPEIAVKVTTTWEVGSPVLVSGFHHVAFENKGRVLQYSPQRVLQYSQLSSVSRLADRESNYSLTTFRLSPEGAGTRLTVVVENFPTDVIFHHLEFYWRGTIVLLKQLIETETETPV